MTLKAADNPPISFPEDIFAPTPPAFSTNQRWWVARTKSRQEKALAWNLYHLGISYFLPLVPRPQKNKGRMRTAIIPLFNGYLFFKGSQEQRQQALTTSRIAQIIEVNGQEQLAHELAVLASATKNQAGMQLTDFVKKGQKVEIISGPLQGLTGMVKTKKNKHRLVLNLTAIKQAALVEINIDHARPI